VVYGKLFLLSAFLFKAEKKPFSRRIIVLNLQIHDGADPGEDAPGAHRVIVRMAVEKVAGHAA